MYIVFDTETTGLPKYYDAPITNLDNWPHVVQIAWECYDNYGILFNSENFIIKPKGFDIPFNAVKIHGITTKYAIDIGKDNKYVFDLFINYLNKCNFLVGHNINFDINILSAEFIRIGLDINLLKKTIIDTQLESTEYCALKTNIGKNKFKWPTLNELHKKLFGIGFSNAHNAIIDVKITSKCFFELIKIGIISEKKFGINIDFLKKNYKKVNIFEKNIIKNNTNNQYLKEIKKNNNINLKEKISYYNKNSFAKNFSHLHNHTSFSILCSTIDIKSLINCAVKYKMPAIGITDYGNLMGAFHFIDTIEKHNLNIKEGNYIKGVIGCEVFISENYLQKKFTKKNPDIRYNQVLLAKNKKGYHNLMKLCSEGFIYGYYAGMPRVSLDLIKKYKKNLIALSGDLNSQISYTILNKGKIEAEKIFLWWYNAFRNDFYVEILRHGLEEEDHVNEILLKFAKKYGVKYIIQNNTFYLNKNDYYAHDILLCIRDSEKKSTPIGKGKGFRFGFPNNEFYFKDKNQMAFIFSDMPEAFKNLENLIEKIETYKISQKILLPKYNIPDSFKNKNNNHLNNDENNFLRYLTYEGAKKKYKIINNKIIQRIEFELKTIQKIGYPGYFLIVQDFIFQAKNMNISVGPGRGSVAGSIVAYCIGITEIDPIKYDLLFERFLNPDRISLPDIDIDFDDRGRDKIIKWVVNKYGNNQVAQIITYGTMAAKSAIRDTSRVLDLPLYKSNNISKLIPNNISLKKIISENITNLKKNFNNEDIENILKIKNIYNKDNGLEKEVINQASIIEGSLRNTGIHPCGIIITPSNINEHIPISISKDSELLITQFDNSAIEKIGLLKIDFLGLRTLTIIKDALKLIKEKKVNVENMNFISLEDKKTYELFKKGETVAIFQYESLGMQKYLKQLKPDKFEDLIAMNALYRPGPMQYIPNFIARKHGKEKITYDLPEMKEYLKNTYGITIYQEQVMMIAQKLAGFSKGETDILRKAMGKKQIYILNEMKDKFIKNSINKGYPKNILEKIWNDWEYFSSYAFNKSHSTCYAYIAFQTAYLKSHYPSEYMASVLSNNMNNIKYITFLINECKRMNILVLGPDINESEHNFIVNSNGCIRFGILAIKGLGEIVVETIINDRKKNGLYKSIFDFIIRSDLRIVNKKTLESLIYSGAFDIFIEIKRYQYFYNKNNISFLEEIIKYGIKYQKIKKTIKHSLFKNVSDIEIVKPIIPYFDISDKEFELNKEKEVLGVYISSHPLDNYFFELKHISNISIYKLNQNIEKKIGKEFIICGIIINYEKKISINTGKNYLVFLLEDYQGIREFKIFGNEYLKYKKFIFSNSCLYINIFIEKWGNTEINVKILKMYPLKGILDIIYKGIIIKIDIYKLNKYIIDNIENILSNNTGDKNVFIIIKNKEFNLSFISKKYFIKINKNILKDLNKIKELNTELI